MTSEPGCLNLKACHKMMNLIYTSFMPDTEDTLCITCSGVHGVYKYCPGSDVPKNGPAKPIFQCDKCWFYLNNVKQIQESSHPMNPNSLMLVEEKGGVRRRRKQCILKRFWGTRRRLAKNRIAKHQNMKELNMCVINVVKSTHIW